MNEFISPQEMIGQTPEMIDLARKRRMAQMLLQQAQMPQGEMVSGHYVAPSITQMLASALGQYKGMKGMSEADEQAKQIAQGLQQKREAWMGEMPRATPNTSEVGPTIPQQPSAEDYTAWAMKGMQVDPRAAAMGMQSANMAMNREAQAAARAQQEQLRRDQMAQQMRIAQMRQQQGQSPYFQALPSEQGYMRFNARTGQMEPLSVGGKSVLPAAQSPALQGKIVTAKETAEADVKTGTEAKKAVSKSDVMLQQLDQAENILKKGPTGSGAGAAIDAAGRLVGITSEGAKLASQLKSISGWLVANVPRMEGPQSNFDVQNYQQMAGMVGDETRPVQERMAALQEVRRLQQKYKQFNQEKIGQGATGDFGATQPATPKRIRFDAQGNVIQ